jgi:hypothetical protein
MTAPARQRSAKHQFAATMLVLEVFVVLFAALAAFGLRAAPPAVILTGGGALVLALVLAAGILRWPGGYVAGSVLQLPVLAAGLVIPAMFVVGGIFVLLWVASLRLGGRIDRERLERSAAEANSSQGQAATGR